MYLLQRKNLSPRFRAHTYRHVVHTHCILPTNDQTESENRLMVEYPLALQIQKQHVVLAINDSKPPPGSHTLSLSLSVSLSAIPYNYQSRIHAIIFSPKIINLWNFLGFPLFRSFIKSHTHFSPNSRFRFYSLTIRQGHSFLDLRKLRNILSLLKGSFFFP